MNTVQIPCKEDIKEPPWMPPPEDRQVPVAVFALAVEAWVLQH